MLRLKVDESRLPKLHLLGSVLVVLAVALVLAGYFSWQNQREQSAALTQIDQAITTQQRSRLEAEMAAALNQVAFTRSRTESLMRQALVEQVDSAWQMMQAIHAQESGRRPPEEVRRLIVEALRPMRFFEGRGYFFVDDLDGRFILLPTSPQLEGRNGIDNRDDRGHYIMRGLIEAARKPVGQGFSSYRWYRPDQPKVMADKLAYVRRFEPYNWLVGTGDYTYEWENRQKAEALERLRAIQFGQSGRIGVLDREGVSLISPTNRSLEGQRVADMPEPVREPLTQMLALAAQGGGFYSYPWPHPATGQPAQKTALVRVFEPWGWVLVATMFDDDLRGTVSELRQRQQRGDAQRIAGQALALALAVGLGLLSSWGFSVWLRRLIESHQAERKAAEDEIRSLAFFDPLTQLPNRRLMMDRLQQALLSARREGHQGALMFIDLDHFKMVNDTLGHDAGDALLQQVAQRLRSLLRSGDTVARLGGDEFLAMLEGLSAERDEAANHCQRLAEKILADIAKPYTVADQTLTISCSIGIALFGPQDTDAEALMKQADLAMYQVKTEGRNALRFFDPPMQAEVEHRAELDRDMRLALAQQQFRLLFQPQFHLSGQMVGAEALVRWQHPQRGMVSPADFVPVAEDNGLVIPLGLWVLQTACEALARWAGNAATAEWTLSVNVSGRQMRQTDFVAQVLHVLRQTGAPPQRLKLELTESLLLDNKEDTIAKMTALKAHGVAFALDDFGTGYSSLAYLRRLPLDQLKIDQSFVRDVVNDPKDAAIVRTVVALSESLGLNVIAEGVETTAQRDRLAAHGCLNYQGYLYGRPCTLGELEALVPR